MSTNIENNDKPHTAPVTENLSLSIIGGGALGALVGIVSGLIVESRHGRYRECSNSI